MGATSNGSNEIRFEGVTSSLAALAGLPNVAVKTVLVSGTGGRTHTTYTVTGANITQSGDLTIDPEIELLVIDGKCTDAIGAITRIGKVQTKNGATRYSTKTAIKSTRTSSTHYSDAAVSLQLGQVIWQGGAIEIAGYIDLKSSNLSIKQGIIESTVTFVSGAATTEPLIAVKTGATIDGLKAIGCCLYTDQQSVALAGYEPFSRAGWVFKYPLSNMTIYGYAGNGLATNVLQNLSGARTKLVGIKPHATGGSPYPQLTFGDEYPGESSSGGVESMCEFAQDVVLKAKTQSGAPIAGAVLYAKDYDHGTRRTPAGSGAVDFVQRRTYITTTTATGEAPAVRVLYAYAYPKNPYNHLASDKVKWAYLGPTNTPNGLFDFYVLGYGFAILPKPAVSMIKDVAVTLGETLIADAAVTLSESAAGALSTVSTLDDLYDAAKYFKTRAVAAQLEYPSIDTLPVQASGAVLRLMGCNLSIDSNAPAVFAIDTIANTITIRSLILAPGVKMKTLAVDGLVTVRGGSTITAPYTDALNAGSIAVDGPDATDTVDLMQIDGTLLASRTGAGGLAVAPAMVGLTAYFVRRRGDGRIACTSDNFTLTAGVNLPVPLYAGHKVQVAEVQGLAKVTDLAALAKTTDLAPLATAAAVTALATANQIEHDATQAALASLPAPLNAAQTQSATATALTAHGAATSAQVAAVGTKADTLQTTAAAIQSKTDTITPAPAGAAVAAAVRTELAPELARIDVATSTRLATTAYTAPTPTDLAPVLTALGNKPTLAQIEATTVLAKAAQVAALPEPLTAPQTQAAAAAAIAAYAPAKPADIPAAPTPAQIRTELEQPGSKLDTAANKAAATWVNTL